MNHRYVFFYIFVDGADELLPELAPEHVEYWRALELESSMGGPFGDRQGGMIIFEAPDLENASVMAQNDPFMVKGIVARHWIKEWVVK
jgi:uncharacterized protein YciI